MISESATLILGPPNELTFTCLTSAVGPNTATAILKATLWFINKKAKQRQRADILSLKKRVPLYRELAKNKLTCPSIKYRNLNSRLRNKEKETTCLILNHLQICQMQDICASQFQIPPSKAQQIFASSRKFSICFFFKL